MATDAKSIVGSGAAAALRLRKRPDEIETPARGSGAVTASTSVNTPGAPATPKLGSSTPLGHGAAGAPPGSAPGSAVPKKLPRGFVTFTPVTKRTALAHGTTAAAGQVGTAAAANAGAPAGAAAGPGAAAAVSTAAISNGGAGAGVVGGGGSYSLAPEVGFRFKTLLEETAERLELLGLITGDANRRRDLPSKANRKDIFSLMLNQRKLEETYAELMTRKNQLRGLSNKSKLAVVMDDLKEVTDALRDSATTISQTLKDQPTSTGDIAKIQRDRSDLQTLIIKTIVELHTAQPPQPPQSQSQSLSQPPAAYATAFAEAGHHSQISQTQTQLLSGLSGLSLGGPSAAANAASAAASAATNSALYGLIVPGMSTAAPSFQTLVEQVTAGHVRRDLLPRAEQRRKQLKEELAEYDLKLAQQKHRFDEELKELNARIQEETRQLKTFREESEASYRFERASLLAKAEQQQRVRKQRLDALSSELDVLGESRELDAIVTQRNTEFLERRQKELDALGAQWAAKHQSEGKAMDDALDRLALARAKDRVRLTFLQKREEKEIAFNAARDAELERRRLEADKRSALLAIQNRAHLKIRFAWRVYHKKVGKPKKKRKPKKPQPLVPSFARANASPRERRTAATVAAELKAKADAASARDGPQQMQNGLPLGSIAARALAVASAQASASASAAANTNRSVGGGSGGLLSPSAP